MCQALSEHLSLLNFAKGQGLMDQTVHHGTVCRSRAKGAPQLVQV